jgi:hypothetical protein
MTSIPATDKVGLDPVRSNNHGFTSFDAVGLSTEHITTATGMREDILLLSWLIVLLRTRDDSNITYEWTYKDQANQLDREPIVRRLVMDQVVSGLNSNLQDTAAVISRHIATPASSQSDETSSANESPASTSASFESFEEVSSPSSLLLSTSSLSRISHQATDEVSD